MAIKIYHNPKCSKSRQALELLERKDFNPEIILYLKTPVAKAEIKNILKLLKASPLQIMRQKESEFKELIEGRNLDDNSLIEAIIATPKLLERPIVINGNKAAIGRPIENILEII